MADIVGTQGIDILLGTNGDDVIEGYDGPDVLMGEQGTNILRGGNGSDQYYIGFTSGSNGIFDTGGTSDYIIAGPGITPDNITFEFRGNDFLVLAEAGGSTSLLAIVGQM